VPTPFFKTVAGFYTARNASVVGNVRIGVDCSIWFNVAIRGDVAPITLGSRVNVQDGAVIHCDSHVANVIEDDVSIAHAAVVHGSLVGRGTLIGMGAKVLGGTKIGRECLIAAGAVVPPGLQVPDGMVVMGVPGKIVRPVREQERQYMRWLSSHYVEIARRHAAGEFKSLIEEEGAMR
jgi:carbonic anhydrase/acetyltransferase-like protein (isoleucine patch superfamily)